MRTKPPLSHFADHVPFEAMLSPNDPFPSTVPTTRVEFLSPVPKRFRLHDPPAFTMNQPRFEKPCCVVFHACGHQGGVFIHPCQFLILPLRDVILPRRIVDMCETKLCS